MPIVLTNAILLDIDPLDVRTGALRCDERGIQDAGPAVVPQPGEEIVDCGGAVVLPGLVNGHTHLYSALAVGMPPPKHPPQNFLEILERIWWRLDRALDGDSIHFSALIGAMDAARCGTTTLIDHHASPNCIEGSLDLIESGIDAVGLRGVLCYETTERNGPGEAEAGLAENRRYLDRCRRTNDRAGRTPASTGHFAGMVGAHAAFTLSDRSLEACVEAADVLQTGVHIHVAEDPCDDRICRDRHGGGLVERLVRCGLIDSAGDVGGRSILAHGTHLSIDTAQRFSRQVAAMAHNPRSNMNNRVGHAPIHVMDRVQLGTDGIGGDMLAELRHAWFKTRDAEAEGPTGRAADGITPDRIVAMLAHSARTASRRLGCTLGRIAGGAAADLVVTDYVPAAPLTADNASGHLLFAIGGQHVRHVLVDGRWILRDRSLVTVTEHDAHRDAARAADALWRRLPAT